jgi:hypothetical protein
MNTPRYSRVELKPEIVLYGSAEIVSPKIIRTLTYAPFGEFLCFIRRR